MNHAARPAFTERRQKGERRTALAGQLEAECPLGDDPAVFEVSWEVCSQSGVIYTVLRSKAPSAVRKWGESYWAVGPYREQAAKIEFEPHRFAGPIADAVHDMQDRGVVVHTGRWLITGRLRVLLLDVNSVAHKLDEWKYFLWKDHGISVYGRDPEVDPIVAFGYAVAELLQAIHRRLNGRP